MGAIEQRETSGGRRLPDWLRREAPRSRGVRPTSQLLRQLRLETVCDHARCPNRMECYSQRIATFMILGGICTRSCGFCAVARGRPEPPDPDEPRRVAEAARRLALRHVVITSVTRDDLPDGGAEQFCCCVRAVRERTGASVEVLIPDFARNQDAVDAVAAAAPDVLNHNVETVPRLYRRVRGPKSDYRWTLELLRRAKQIAPRLKTKSGLMLGLGESPEEVLDVLADLRDVGCDFLTIGQYLQPAPRRLPVVRYAPPEEFTALGEAARQLGFLRTASGPMVRSSYRAQDMVCSDVQRT